MSKMALTQNGDCVVTKCHEDFFTLVLGIVLRIVFCSSRTQALLRVEAPHTRSISSGCQVESQWSQ